MGGPESDQYRMAASWWSWALLCCFASQYTIISAESLIAEDVSTTVGVGANLTCSFHTNTTYASVKLNITKSIGDISDFVFIQEANSSVHLLITAAILTDAGEYECVAVVDNTTITMSFSLQVTEAPPLIVASITPTSQSVSLGADVTFSCNASAATVTYLWLKIDQSIEPNIKTSLLVLRNVSYFDMGTYSCVAILGNQRVTASANLRINEYRAPFTIGNPGHFNAIDSADTLVVNCDVMGSPPPSFVWEKSKVPVPVLNIRPHHYSGPYVAANGSLMLVFAAASDSGIYVCYGIDPVTKVNVSSSYHITINTNEIIWTTWYFFVIYGIVALFLTIVFLLLCYFCASALDICSCKIRRKRRMKMDSIEADQSGWPWLDTIQMSAPNLAYEMNFGEKHSLLQQPTNIDDGIVLNNNLETSNKQRRQATQPSEPLTTEEVTVPEITVEQYDAHEEDRIIQSEDNQPKGKKNKKEKKTKKDKTESTTELFLY